MTIFHDKIFTRRLLLRRLRREDLSLLVDWSQSKKCYGEFLTPDKMTIEQVTEQFAANYFWNEKNRFFLIEAREHAAIGTIHYWLRPEKNDIAVMAVKIALPDKRLMGYGTEAQKYLIIHLFDTVRISSVEMYTDIDNFAQQRCLQKLGFEIVKSLTYEDQHVVRTGHLYRLSCKQYHAAPLYKYHYE
ncbi:MAG: GNAT family N-acetyltransferase [Pseudomonadota bacterium]